ncbi:MAG: hypothetical protein A2X02_05160 [Bacteroidetes bacterium GWF2_29_10]|nr:MAG: hypothetical protein A2X02_05160 [Bacteroidetes bacterium GWF2_29_10]
MKKYLTIICFFVFVIFIVQCKKDDNLNKTKIASKAILKSISIKSLNLRNLSNDQWDITNGPEIYIKITNDTGYVYYQSSVIENDVDINDLPINHTFDKTLAFENFAENLYVEVWDYDNDTTSEQIDWCKLNFSNYINTLPSTINLTNKNSDSQFDLNIEWE